MFLSKYNRKTFNSKGLRFFVFSPKLVLRQNTIMKIINSTHVNPFGGLNFVLEEFERQGIGKLLEQNLPKLPNQCKYSWKDILYSFWSIYFCGGDCIEDISINLKEHLKNTPFLKTPSPDRILDRFKELSLPRDLFTLPRGISLHQFSLNPFLNELNLKMLKLLNFKVTEAHILDYDNTILYTNKLDSKSTYKKAFGYAPGVGIIGNKIVFVENRNGNSAAKDLQCQTLTRMFSELQRQDISIDTFRADAASYQLNVVHLIAQKTRRFFIRACMSGALAQKIAEIKDWTQVKVGSEVIFRGEIKYTPFTRTLKRKKRLHEAREYRLVVSKVERNDKQVNMFTKDAFLYSAILTNDYNLSTNEVVEFYNQRGAIEKEFDILKNDFGWKNLPFSKLEQNTVFLIFTAICRNLYQYIIEVFSLKFEGLNPKFRIKKFIFRFISIPAKWIKTARQYKLRVYGNIHFKT